MATTPLHAISSSASNKLDRVASCFAQSDRGGQVLVKLNDVWQRTTVCLVKENLVIFSADSLTDPPLVCVKLLGKTVRTLDAREVRAEVPQRNCFVIEGGIEDEGELVKGNPKELHVLEQIDRSISGRLDSSARGDKPRLDSKEPDGVKKQDIADIKNNKNESNDGDNDEDNVAETKYEGNDEDEVRKNIDVNTDSTETPQATETNDENTNRRSPKTDTMKTSTDIPGNDPDTTDKVQTSTGAKTATNVDTDIENISTDVGTDTKVAVVASSVSSEVVVPPVLKLPFEAEKELKGVMISCKDSTEAVSWIAVLQRATISNQWTGSTPIMQRYTDTAETANVDIPYFQPLSNAALVDAPALLRKKVAVCAQVWYFDKDGCGTNVALKDYKRRTLVELVQFMDEPRAQHAFVDDRALHDVIDMISLNLFRPVVPIMYEPPPIPNIQFMEPSWEHVSLTYELLLHVVECSVIPLDMKKRCFTADFCGDIIQLFRAPDVREREYVKVVAHCLYSRLMNRRARMRRSMANMFLGFLCEPTVHNGIAEMLEVYGSVASGFAVPIKQEHLNMLFKCLLPLHKSPFLEFYHEQLCFILIQYTNKDPALCVETIRAVLRYWPSTSSSKQILYLNEIEELIEVLQPEYLPPIQDVLLRRLCKCIESSHFQVAERALALWNNEILCAVMLENRDVRDMSYPMLFSSLLRTWKTSWNKGVQQLAEGLLGFLQALDYDMYHRCEAMRVAR